MTMANIAFFVSNIDPFIGGTERVTQSIAENLVFKGYNTFFVYTNADNHSISINKKMRILYSDTVENIVNQVQQFILINEIRVMIVVNRVFQSVKYQKVFSLLKKNTNVKIIISLHAAPDSWVNKNKWGLVLPKVYFKESIKSFIFNFYNPHIRKVIGSYQVSDKYLLLSKSYIKMFEQTYHIDDKENKLIAIPNPCPFKDSYNGVARENIVLAVSRMQEDQKRIFCMLRIWARIYKYHSDWKLVVVGDGPDFTTYKQMASKLSNIMFEGHSSNVQSYYKKSKIFMMTSIWEGLPMTLIEAMHYGCVPIAFDSFAALYDLIDNGNNGFIIPNNDIDCFVKKISFMMDNKQYLEKMSSRILQHPNIFQMNDIIQIWDHDLKQLL